MVYSLKDNLAENCMSKSGNFINAQNFLTIPLKREKNFYSSSDILLSVVGLTFFFFFALNVSYTFDQVYNALGVSYVRDNQLDKGITQFETAVKLQPGYVTAWNNLGDAYEKRKDLRAALKAFEEVLLFDPNNKVARPRRDALRARVQLYKGVPLKSEDR